RAPRAPGRPRLGLGLAVAWVLAPDVHMGVMFDYNQTPAAAALLLWVACAMTCRAPVAVLITARVACGGKGNFCIYVAVMAHVLAFRYKSWRRGAAVMGLSL